MKKADQFSFPCQFTGTYPTEWLNILRISTMNKMGTIFSRQLFFHFLCPKRSLLVPRDHAFFESGFRNNGRMIFKRTFDATEFSFCVRLIHKFFFAISTTINFILSLISVYFRMGKFGMLSMRKKYSQIFRIIIGRFSVNMVNTFLISKIPTQLFLHYYSMFGDITLFIRIRVIWKKEIPILPSLYFSFIRIMEFTFAIMTMNKQPWSFLINSGFISTSTATQHRFIIRQVLKEINTL